MIITKTVPIPETNPEVIALAYNVYYKPTGASIGISGYIKAIAPRSVTLYGKQDGGGAEKSETITTQQLKGNDYTALRYSPDQLMTVTSEDVSSWTTDVDTLIFDPDVCRPGYFIQILQAVGTRQNGLISAVGESTMTVVLLDSRTGKATTGPITVADTLRPDFDAIVAADLSSGGGGGNTVNISTEVM